MHSISTMRVFHRILWVPHYPKVVLRIFGEYQAHSLERIAWICNAYMIPSHIVPKKGGAAKRYGSNRVSGVRQFETSIANIDRCHSGKIPVDRVVECVCNVAYMVNMQVGEQSVDKEWDMLRRNEDVDFGEVPVVWFRKYPENEGACYDSLGSLQYI